MNSTLFDKRVISRNIDKGILSQDEYHKHLNNLEDLSGKCEEIDVSLYDDDKEDEAGRKK
jgi:pyrimidine operon attenuation protein/uracil phosphoribosyltransferase